ncbi:AzlC family ABC transporter permease [Alysiella crassa]|uniref:Inner membrane protein YgaZ n=1 Tax=Alysiella crassa TaxID=153491 RepID=A0A376BLL0_9NEIS|nr:AzlC family ABC transporter permease [Alysiella crassa]UOP07287.1 AzlC family ABC transporter permease [Alysiella crassa]SSY70538.1 Inner membrane protein YgaZ [Alysiella crassa]
MDTISTYDHTAITCPIQEKAFQKQEFWRGVKDALPIMLGFIPFALVLGASAVGAGFKWYELSLLTTTNLAGGSEFTVVSLWQNPLNIPLIVAMATLVNSRHIIMGATFSLLLKGMPKKKALPLLFVMIDESWAMAIADAQKHGRKALNVPYYLGVAILLCLTWIVFTTAGAYFAPLIGDLKQYGMDMAFTAVFLVLLKGMWRGFQAALPWLASLLGAGLCHHLFDGAWYVAVGALAGVATAFFMGDDRTEKN